MIVISLVLLWSFVIWVTSILSFLLEWSDGNITSDFDSIHSDMARWRLMSYSFCVLLILRMLSLWLIVWLRCLGMCVISMLIRHRISWLKNSGERKRVFTSSMLKSHLVVNIMMKDSIERKRVFKSSRLKSYLVVLKKLLSRLIKLLSRLITLLSRLITLLSRLKSYLVVSTMVKNSGERNCVFRSSNMPTIKKMIRCKTVLIWLTVNVYGSRKMSISNMNRSVACRSQAYILKIRGSVTILRPCSFR